MKKILLSMCIVLFSVTSHSQKKTAAIKKSSATSVTLPKLENLQVEVINGNFQVAIIEKGKTNAVLIVKEVVDGFKANNCKLSSFVANGVKLYLLSWTELSSTKSALKTEDKTTIYNVVYEILAKKQVYSNYQLTNNIKEQVFLDKNKTASETQEKIRREGFEFVLNFDGSITQKSKTQNINFVYKKDKMEFVVK